MTGTLGVDFGSLAATGFIVNSSTSVSATSPVGTGTVDVTVQTPAGISATGTPDRFSYSAPTSPNISGISPVSGSTGATVVISGSNLGNAISVTFGTVAAAPTADSSTAITVTAPAGTGSVAVKVLTPAGQATSPDQFAYYTPGLLRVTTSPAVPSQVSVDGAVADTWGLNWVKEPPGSHTVCFSDVGGFGTPACQQVTVASGQTTAVVGSFTQYGYVKVQTSPALPAEVTVTAQGSSAPAAEDDWGAYTDVAPGTYNVCFGAVAGWAPPACQQVTVAAGSTTPVTGTYTASAGAAGQSGVGYLRVTTSPALPSQVSVDGHGADTWGLNWLEIAPGSHTVCFSSVQGYSTPACQAVTVSTGATTTVAGTFAQRGYLHATTSPAVAGTVYLGGAPADDWGDWTDLAPGSYTVCFGAVAGYTAPACQAATVTAGATTPVTGNYTA